MRLINCTVIIKLPEFFGHFHPKLECLRLIWGRNHSKCDTDSFIYIFLSAGAIIFVTFISAVLTATIPMCSNECLIIQNYQFGFNPYTLRFSRSFSNARPHKVYSNYGHTNTHTHKTKHPLKWYGFSSILCFIGWHRYWLLMSLFWFSYQIQFIFEWHSLNTRITNMILQRSIRFSFFFFSIEMRKYTRHGTHIIIHNMRNILFLFRCKSSIRLFCAW